MSDNLKPCPCCGSENVSPIFMNKGLPFEAVAAACNDCELRTQWKKYFEDGKKVWNTRPGDPVTLPPPRFGLCNECGRVRSYCTCKESK